MKMHPKVMNQLMRKGSFIIAERNRDATCNCHIRAGRYIVVDTCRHAVCKERCDGISIRIPYLDRHHEGRPYIGYTVNFEGKIVDRDALCQLSIIDRYEVNTLISAYVKARNVNCVDASQLGVLRGGTVHKPRILMGEVAEYVSRYPE